jgi:hypothetical protein
VFTTNVPVALFFENNLILCCEPKFCSGNLGYREHLAVGKGQKGKERVLSINTGTVIGARHIEGDSNRRSSPSTS